MAAAIPVVVAAAGALKAAAVPLAIGAVTGAAGAAVSAVGQYKQAKAQQRALDAEAKVERMNAYQRERAARRAGMLQVRRQQLAAQSGGLLLEGSPLEQLARNTFEVEYQALNERNAGLNRASYLRWQGHVAKQTARRNIPTSIVMGGLSGAASGFLKFGGSAPPPASSSGTGLIGPSGYGGVPR